MQANAKEESRFMRAFALPLIMKSAAVTANVPARRLKQPVLVLPVDD